jgi:hypothetical protein
LARSACEELARILAGGDPLKRLLAVFAPPLARTPACAQQYEHVDEASDEFEPGAHGPAAHIAGFGKGDGLSTRLSREQLAAVGACNELLRTAIETRRSDNTVSVMK